MLLPASQVVAAPISWLWPNYLAEGCLAILDGDPGVGKSLLTLDLAARLSTARPWPDGSPNGDAGSVLLLCAEDSHAVIAERLRTLGADLDRVFLLPRGSDTVRLPSRLTDLETAIAASRARLIVIDPILAHLDPAIEMSSDARTRQCLQPLDALADRRRCTILMVRHLNKKEGQKSLYRGGGSIALVAASRIALLASRLPRSSERNVLVQQKNNYGTRPAPLAYKPGPAPNLLQWLGPLALDPDTLSKRPKRRGRALRLLHDYLLETPRTADEVDAFAEEHRIPTSTLYRIKNKLQVQIVGTRQPRQAWWLLPGQSLLANSDPASVEP